MTQALDSTRLESAGAVLLSHASGLLHGLIQQGRHALILLQQAEAELAEAVRNVATLKARVETLKQRAIAKQAALHRVRHDLVRFKAAVSDGAASEQQVQNAEDEIRDSESARRTAGRSSAITGLCC